MNDLPYHILIPLAPFCCTISGKIPFVSGAQASRHCRRIIYRHLPAHGICKYLKEIRNRHHAGHRAPVRRTEMSYHGRFATHRTPSLISGTLSEPMRRFIQEHKLAAYSGSEYQAGRDFADVIKKPEDFRLRAFCNRDSGRNSISG